MKETVEFLGLPFDNLTVEEALDKIEDFIHEGVPRKIFTPNVLLLMWSRRDEFLRSVYRSCDMLTVDGMAIFYALRLLGTPVKASASASLLFYPILARAQKKGYGVYLLGAKEAIVREAADRITHEFPGIRIVGWHDGYFDVSDASDVVEDIRRAQPDVLLVGMCSPLKERFVETHMHTMNVPVSIGVGGMLDIAAGHAQFAPDWVRKLCIEWLYRLVQEPRRLFKRYMTTNPVFCWLVLKELVKQRLPSFGKGKSGGSASSSEHMDIAGETRDGIHQDV